MSRPTPVAPAQALAALDQLLEGLRCQCTADLERQVLEAGGGAFALTGFTPEQLVGSGRGLRALVHPEDRETVDAAVISAIEFGTPYRIEYRLVSAEGIEKWVIERGLCPRDEAGERRFHVFLEDIMARVNSQIRRAETEVRYRSMFDNAILGVFQSTEDGRYLSVNQALADIYGFATPEELIATLSDIGHRLYVDPERRREFQRQIATHGRVVDFESEVYRADGRRIWISENAWAVRAPAGELLYYEGMVRDITERRQHQDALRHQAMHDPLTGLVNRTSLPHCLEEAARRFDGEERQVALAFIDLDNFKVVNDSLGHAAGDNLLKQVARRLQSTLRRSDTVARYGGDEFVLILAGARSTAEVELSLSRVLAAIQAPMRLGEHEVHVNCSIGVALHPQDADDLSGLLRIADMAMYEAKARGKGQYHFYTGELNRAAHERFVLEGALRTAIEREEIRPVFQPKIDADGRVCGCEALARWHSPEHGMITPDRFIPIAEETGLILPLGWQILRAACREAAGWPTVDGRGISVAVNISARQLADPELVEIIRAALDESGLPPDLLDIEITESMLMGDFERTIEVLRSVRALGVKVAVDDFGTGYSSLSYLRRLPIDVLKIDRSFVNGCEHEGEAMVIPHAIIFLGKSLRLRIVAEGVEEQAQVDILRLCGCDEFQGYFYARPMPVAELRSWMAARQSA